jgi:site-specific DNA-methyltransferase (adenine-specific)
MTHFAFNADCMEIMSRYPDKWFDLAVVDPEYGIDVANMNMGTGKGKKCSKIQNRKWKPKDWDKSIPNKIFFDELFRVSKNQIIWGGNYFGLPAFKHFIVWDKGIPDGMSFSDCELAWTSFNKSQVIFKYSIYKTKTDRIHPTQKPVALYDWIFKNYLPNGGRVLDTHGGSMSSLISAIKAGNIEMTISELDADYYASAQKRLNDFMSQLNLFQERPNIIW